MNETDDKKAPTLMVILLKAAVLVLIVLCIFFIAYPHACINLIEGRQTEDQSIQDINKPLIQANKDVTPAQTQQVQTQQTVTTTVTAPQPAGQQNVVVTMPAAQQTAGQTVIDTATGAVQTTAQTAAQTGQTVVNTATGAVQNAVQTGAQTVTQTAQTATQTTQDVSSAALDSAIKQQQELQAQQDVYDYNVVKRYVAVEKDYLLTHPNDNAAQTAITQQVMNEYQLNDQEWQEIIQKANTRGWFDALRNK